MPYVVLLLTLLLAAAGDPAAVLQIRSHPGVEVLWEGVVLGETDSEGLLVIEDIPAGDYRLALKASEGSRRELQVSVSPGENKVLELPLGPAETPSAEASLNRRTTSSPDEPVGRPDNQPGSAQQGMSPPLPPARIALVLVALAGTVLIYVLWRKAAGRERSQAFGSETLNPAPDNRGVPLFEVESPDLDVGSPAFLDDLKRREQNLESLDEQNLAPATPMIIEVEATEIRRTGRSDV